MAQEDAKIEEKEWPTYVEFERMQKTAEDFRNGCDWAKMSPQQMAEAQKRMTDDGTKARDYTQKISKAIMEWNSQWMTPDGDEKENVDPDMAFMKSLMESSNTDAVMNYGQKLQSLMVKMHTEAKNMEEYTKICDELLKMEKDFHGKTLKKWQDWKPKKMEHQDMRALTLNNTKKILAMKEKTYELQILQGKIKFEMMTMSAEERTKVMAGMGTKQQELTALDKEYAFEPTEENKEAAMRAWKSYADSLLNHPLSLPLDISVKAYEKAVKDSTTLSGYDNASSVLLKAHELWEESLKNKKPAMHPYSLFIAQEIMLYNTSHKDPYAQRARECETVYNDLCTFLEKMSKGTLLTHDEKKYAKFLLVWRWQGPPMDGGKDYYHLLQSKATQVMNMLRKPLDEEYSKLSKKDSPIIKMKLNDKYKCRPEIKSQRELLSHAWDKWFTDENISLTDDEIKLIKSNYKEWGFDYFGTKASEQAKKDGTLDYDKELELFFISLEQVTPHTYMKFLSTDIVVLDIINQIAYKVDKIFQPKMEKLFELNREKLNLEKLNYPLNSDDIKNKNIGVFKGPLKAKARQIIKCESDYKFDPSPKSGSVLDDVRCAIVLEDDVELASLFQMICSDEKNGYKGRIYRAKNAFSDVKKNSFGYRAVLINVIETYSIKDSSGKQIDFPLIVEIQLILKSYFQVRKSMHLGYSIVRAETPHQLAKDACKEGNLDI